MGAVGGRRDVMSVLAPLGSVYQAGIERKSCGIGGWVNLDLAVSENPYAGIAKKAEFIASEIKLDESASIRQFGGLFTLFFGEFACNLADVQKCDMARYGRFFHAMLKRFLFVAVAI